MTNTTGANGKEAAHHGVPAADTCGFVKPLGACA
jgi:hypothetical protein